MDEHIMDSVQCELGVFFHGHLGHNAGAVSADGFDAQTEFIGDIGNGLSSSQHKHHLMFTVGEPLVGKLLSVYFQFVSQFFRQG